MRNGEADTPAAVMLRAVLALSRRLRAQRPADGVSLSALGILGTLHRIGPVPAKRLALEERLRPQSLTRLIGGLEAGGLIVRTRNPGDQREILIDLSDKGRTVFAEDMRARGRWLERAMREHLTAEERAALAEASGIMLKLAEPNAAPTPTAV